MKRRIQIIEEAQPNLAVSIHQNSYGEEYVNGAQVFYYNGSVKKQGAGGDDPKPDDTVSGSGESPAGQGKRQLLPAEKTGKPIVIVECGFLSNSAEAEKLCDNYYQEKVAWNIHMSIMQYLNTREK